jgi:nucleoside-diphosphate-sugar epimerase
VGALTGRLKSYMGMRTLVAEFYRTLREGLPPPVDASDAILTVRLLEQVRNALADRQKRRVTVGDCSSPARVLVTGATGFLGGRLVERLAEEGVVVRATTRIGSRARRIEGVDWIRCNLASEDELRQAMTGIETVFHCAAMAGPPGSLEDYQEANVHGTLRVAKIAEETGVRELVYVSSLSVYARPRRGVKYVDEATPYDERAGERGVYTQSKIGAERALLDHARAHPRLRVVVVRPGILYGPGAPLPIGCLELPSPFRRRPLVAGSRSTPIPLSFIDNVIDAMFAASSSDVSSGSVFNVVDDAECTQGLVASYVAEATEGRVRPYFVPYPVVWALMLMADVLAFVRHRKLGTARYRLARTLADMRYQCVAAREKLKWAPRVSASEGIARVLAVMDETPYPH